MHLIVIFLISISLSMDAFSLSLAYGTLSLENKQRYLLSSIVGIYHFIMPLLGLTIGHILTATFHIDPKIIVLLIFTFIGIQMIFETLKKDDNVKKLNIVEMFLFGLAVSLDSFSIGIGLQVITSHIFIVPIIFSITSFIFTYLGLYLGNTIQNIFGKIATIIGGLFLIIFGIIYFFK